MRPVFRYGLSALLIALALPGSAALADGKDKEADALRPAGKAVDCVYLPQIESTRVRDDSTIDFIMRNGKVYRNSLPYSCPSLGFEERFTYSTSLSQLCSVDIVTVLYSTGGGLSRGASCGLGKFQPMEKAPPAG